METEVKEKKAVNKYDLLIKLFYLVFGVGALIIYLCVSLINEGDWNVWILGFFGAACGAAAWGTLAYFIISLVRKDKEKINKYDLVSRMIYIIFFIVATIAFIAIGFKYGTLKIWIIAFIGAYGAAIVYGTIAKLIITLVRIRKDKQVE
jgi:hypothetical protein